LSRNPKPAGFHIFLSYRRESNSAHAGRLHDFLVAGVEEQPGFRDGQIFMDIDTIPPGDDFREVIAEAVARCDVLLVVIGKQWTTVKNEKGRRRLDNAGDFVRLEIEAALKRKVPVVPVLVDGATMPDESELPKSIADLAYRNAVELSHTRWRHDVGQLLTSLKKRENAKAQPNPPRTSRTPRQQGGTAKPKATTPSTAKPSERKTGPAKPKSTTSSRGTAKRKATASSAANPSERKVARKTKSTPEQTPQEQQPSHLTGTPHDIFATWPRGTGLRGSLPPTSLRLSKHRVGDVYHGRVESLALAVDAWAKVLIGPETYGKLPGLKLRRRQTLMRTEGGDLVGVGDVISVKVESVNPYRVRESDRIVLSYVEKMPANTPVGPAT
jgi:hypothetical protein